MLTSEYFSLKKIRKSCPAINSKEAEELIRVTETDCFIPTVGIADCFVPVERRARFGCRNVTGLSSTGCLLRDGPIKVDLS